jgi:hypothetical protein
MSVELYPERKLATRLVTKKDLVPPIDIFSLAAQYARVDSMSIPFDVDGISLHLKVPGRTPHIIVNDRYPSHRVRFTLAHELGHVLVPWHIGSIVDNTSTPEETRFDEYWCLESEANRFASELLMPGPWVKSIIEKQKHDIYKITEQIVKRADVSSHAATIRIKDTISSGYVFVALTENDEVVFSGRSGGTLASPPMWSDKITPEKLLPFCQSRFRFEINGFHYYWWFIDEKIPIPRSAVKGDWRDLLDEIILEIGIPISKRDKFKQSLNGVIAFANGQVRGKNRTPESLYSAALQRIHGRSELTKLLNHPKFDSFISSKIDTLLKREQLH